MKTIRFFDPEGEISVGLVEDALALVGHTLRRRGDEVWAWTDFELLLAYDWAIRVHLRASDNSLTVRSRPRPSFVVPS